LGTRTANMPSAPSGACASCHNTAGQGRVYLP
jgi:cytochrome c553